MNSDASGSRVTITALLKPARHTFQNYRSRAAATPSSVNKRISMGMEEKSPPLRVNVDAQRLGPVLVERDEDGGRKAG